MIKFLTALVFNAAALALTALLLGDKFIVSDGASDSEWLDRILIVAGIAAIFTVVNVYIAPIVKLLALPFIIVTLGFFLLVINALLLLFTEWLAGLVNLPFEIAGFWWAVLASIIISITNAILAAIFD